MDNSRQTRTYMNCKEDDEDNDCSNHHQARCCNLSPFLFDGIFSASGSIPSYPAQNQPAFRALRQGSKSPLALGAQDKVKFNTRAMNLIQVLMLVRSFRV